MKKISKQKKENGYTIIETMIAVSLFIIIVMIGMNALLNANLVSSKSQKMRSILDNMNFVMEDMSRNLRTGTTYDCFNGTAPVNAVATSGSNCTGVAFNPNGGGTWSYYIKANSVWKKDGTTDVEVTPDEVSIDPVSGFSVLGAQTLGQGDRQQPFVIINIVGTITYQKVVTTFSLQTSVSQRKIDNI